jgi:hypothetical protein
MTPEERKREQLARLDAKIAEAKAKKRRLLGAEARDRRRIENRRKVLAGAAVLFEAEGSAEFHRWLYGLLGRFLTRTDERALFGFEPLAGRPELVVVHHSSAQGSEESEHPLADVVEKREAEPA